LCKVGWVQIVSKWEGEGKNGKEGEKGEEEGTAVCACTTNTAWKRQGEIITQFIHVKTFWEYMRILASSHTLIVDACFFP